MISKIGVSLVLLVLSFTVSASENLEAIAYVKDSLSTDSAVSNETIESRQETPSLRLLEFEFQLFKNYKEKKNASNTLETGSVKLQWKTPLYGPHFLTYGEEGKPLSDIILPDSATSIILDSLPENVFMVATVHKGLPNQSTQFSEALKFHTISKTAFKFLSSKSGEGSTELYWGINADHFVNKGYTKALIKYNTKVGKKHQTREWEYVIVDLEDLKYELEDLMGNTDYVYNIGIPKDGNVVEALHDIMEGKTVGIIWSKEGKFKPKRTWGFVKFLMLIGALGFFIFGMKLMSEGLQRAAGNKLRQVLGSMTSNRVKGVFSGFLITGIVQSSSATTVMTVSLVNAGLLTLVQSAGIMMGANIGTTITGWLISTFGFKVSLSDYSLMMIAIALPMFFVRSPKIKAWGQALMGFAILFWGLGELKGMVPKLDIHNPIVQFFADFQDSFFGPVMFVLLGALVTVIIQSSSASMALTLAMVAGGIIPFQAAAAMILGENIGTTITAELASLIGNVHAKRSARIHSMFNVIGVVWMLFAIPLVLPFVVDIMMNLDIISADPFIANEEGKEAATLALAGFHTVFNLTNVLLLIWFVPQLVNFAIKSVKSKGDNDEEFHLDYITTGALATAELSLLEAKKEVAKFGKITSRMNGFVSDLLTEKEKKKKSKLYQKIQKYEDITDRVEVEIANYLSKVSQSEMTDSESIRVRSMLSITNDFG